MKGIRCVVAVLVPTLAAAQSPSPVRLTLEDAIARGLAVSHRLAEAAARGEAADAVVALRHAALLPQIAGQAGFPSGASSLPVTRVPFLSENVTG